MVAWRASVIGSAASDEGRTGLVDATKLQAYASEARRLLFQEAEFAFAHAGYAAELQAMDDSRDPALRAQAVQLRQFVLPQLAQLTPLTGAKYQKADGAPDYEKRLAELRAETPRIAQLKPQEAFARADSLYAQQRGLVWSAVLMAISLFCLALSQLTDGRRRRIAGLVLAVLFFGSGLLGTVVASTLLRVVASRP